MATPHRLKPKPLRSATLPHTWPKPIFPFKGSKGHLPVEAQPYVFVCRKIAHGRNKDYKLVPEMIFPIHANRQAVPCHEVLEDEYRAFHNVMVNHMILARRFLTQQDPRMLFDVQWGLPVDTLLQADRISQVKDQLPELMAYNPGCQPPPGYMYQRYKSALGTGPVKSARKAKPKCPSLLPIRGPRQNVVCLKTRNFLEKTEDFDSAVIGQPVTKVSHAVRIYNEPDAVSSLALDSGFGQPISKRAKRVYTRPTEKKTA